jgi:hypothetical protein
MKAFSRLMALAGLLVSVGADARPGVATCIEGASFSGAPHSATYHGKRGVQTRIEFQASIHKLKVSGFA